MKLVRSRAGTVYDKDRRYGYRYGTPEWAPRELPERNAEIVRRVKAGESRKSVAVAFGLTYEWVRQIVKRAT